MMTDKQKFYHLLGEVCETLPVGAIDSLARNDYQATTIQLMQVRQGRIINLKHLVALVRVGLPDFEIPGHLLPVEPEQVAC